MEKMSYEELADIANHLVDEIRNYLRDNQLLRSRMNAAFRIADANLFGWHLLGDRHKYWSDMIASGLPHLMENIHGFGSSGLFEKRRQLAVYEALLVDHQKWLIVHLALVDEIIKLKGNQK